MVSSADDCAHALAVLGRRDQAVAALVAELDRTKNEYAGVNAVNALTRIDALTAIPDAYRGEAVLAVISLRAGETVDIDEVRAFVRERLAAYKVPKRIVFVDAIPRLGSGKIDRRATAALIPDA